MEYRKVILKKLGRSIDVGYNRKLNDEYLLRSWRRYEQKFRMSRG